MNHLLNSIKSLLHLKFRICLSKQNIKMVHSLAPPESVRGMKNLDRDAFSSTYDVPCLNLGSVPNHKIMPAVKKYLLKLRQYKPVQNLEGNLIVFLDPEKVEKFEDISEADRSIISKYTQLVDRKKITLKYENWFADKIFKATMPEGIEMPSSYTKVGHIVHLNLRDNQLPFKQLIGQVYLDLTSNTKTVVNKLSNIDAEFRNFSMEILAGEDDTIATVKENNCQFTFDFAKVYWNSRLCTEHGRLLEFMVKGDVLYDVFAGVGPFAVPAARKGVNVLANDLNPESFKWLQANAKSNKTKSLTCFNKDGRDFLRQDVKEHLLKRRNQNAIGSEHIAMNLPALAFEFLDVFHDWLNEDEIKLVAKNPPLVHLYCFVKVGKQDDPKPAAKSLVESIIGHEISSESLKVIYHVRNVAPNKEMMRVSFYLTEDLMQTGEPARKRIKISEEINLNNTKISENHGEKQEADKDEKCV